VSGTVRDHIGDRLDLAFNDMDDQSLKNIARPVRVYRARLGGMEGGTAGPEREVINEAAAIHDIARGNGSLAAYH
jgi:hypothetical protein